MFIMSIKNFDKFSKLIKTSNKQDIMEEMNITENEYQIYVQELEDKYLSDMQNVDDEEDFIDRNKVENLMDTSLDMSSMILKGVGYLSTKFIDVADVNLYINNYVNLCKPMLDNFGINDILKFNNVEEMSMSEKLIISGIYMSAMLYISKQATEMQLKQVG